MRLTIALSLLGHLLQLAVLAGFALAAHRTDRELHAVRQELAAERAVAWVAAGRVYPTIYSARWISRWECAGAVQNATAPEFLRGALKGCEAVLEVYRAADLDQVRARVQARVPPGTRVWLLEERGERERPLPVAWTASIRR